MFEKRALSDVVAAIEATGDFRVLRRLQFDDRAKVKRAQSGNLCILVVGVEATGTDLSRDKIVELAARPFWADSETFEIVKVGRMYSWLEDHGQPPLTREVTSSTGLTEAHLAGRGIDEKLATRLLKRGFLIVAYNAAFVRRITERRLPEGAGYPWACIRAEVDWLANGFEVGPLRWLLLQAGYFQPDGRHRAGADVDAVVGLLGVHLVSGRTVLEELFVRARTPTHQFCAVGASVDRYEALRGRGYRWEVEAGVWVREVSLDESADERAWLMANIYAPQFQPKMPKPAVKMIDWWSRYAS
ncbi:MAG: hypothetical protein ACLPN5_19510 [Roseiarcus sp.]